MEKVNPKGLLLLAFCVCMVIVGILTPGVHSCSPPIGPAPPDTAESSIHYADVVVYGTVIQHYTDSQAPFDAFIAEMEIRCIFKGAPVERFINVTNAGIVGGMCFSTRLDIGKLYVVFLSRAGGDRYMPIDTDIEVTGLTDPYLSNITRVCDLSTQYPPGMNELNSRFRCPQTDQSVNCTRHVLPTTDHAPEVHTEIFPPTDTTPTDLKNFPGPEVKESANIEKTPSGCGHLNLNNILGVTSLIAIIVFIR